MSQGLPWVGRVMHPIAELGAPAQYYNRIYEAVMRGDEQQGQALVRAVIELLLIARQSPDASADSRRMSVLRGCSTAVMFSGADNTTTVVLGPATTKKVPHSTFHGASIDDALDSAARKGFGAGARS